MPLRYRFLHMRYTKSETQGRANFPTPLTVQLKGLAERLRKSSAIIVNEMGLMTKNDAATPIP